MYEPATLILLQMRKEMKTMLEASEQSTTRAVTDLDVRMQSIKQKVVNLEQLFDGRISEVIYIPVFCNSTRNYVHLCKHPAVNSFGSCLCLYYYKIASLQNNFLLLSNCLKF